MAKMQDKLTAWKNASKPVSIELAGGQFRTGYIVDDGSTNGHDCITMAPIKPKAGSWGENVPDPDGNFNVVKAHIVVVPDLV